MAGVRLAGWTADALLGAGGMGAVYRVRHASEPGPRALKVLGEPGAELRARLRREARIGTALAHPNTLLATDWLEADERVGLLMDYVPGPSLAEVLAQGAPPEAAVRAIGAQVLAGVAAAHGAGILHRDLKPSNVLLAPDGDGLRARVADWGLARVEIPVDSLRTRPGIVGGTLAYLAPERLRGGPATRQSDVFALGVLLYELCTGVRPFAGADRVELIDRLETAEPPSVDGVPADLAAAILTALARDPADRPGDASELAGLWGAAAPWPAGWVSTVAALHRPTPLRTEREHSLPELGAPFVGREGMREAVAAAVAGGQVTTLVGTGGVGKTRLAVQVAHDLLERFGGGAWFCDASAARSAEGVAAALGRGLGVALGPDPIASAGAAIARVGRALVVVDNLEQVAEHAAATVGRWVEAAPEVVFLATSRVPLGLPRETVLRVDVLPEDEAVALFTARARRAMPTFTVAEDNRAAVQDLVAQLDGLPLALEIAAARVRDRGLQRLVERLSLRLGRLPRADRASAAHQRTLQATLDWSWDLLSPAERLALARLSVFRGGASLAAAAEVLHMGGDVAEVLDGLVRHGLVRRDGGRVGLLETVRTWAASKLDEQGDRVEVERRHGAHFMGFAGSASVLDIGLRTTYNLEVENFEAATRRALAAGDRELARGCLAAGWVAWGARGGRGIALELAQALLALPDADDATRMTGLHIASMAVAYTNREADAIGWLQEAIASAERLGRDYDVRNMLGSLVGVLVQRDPPEGERQARRLLAMSEAAGDRRRIGEALSHLAAVALARSDLDLCRSLSEQSLEHELAVGDLEAAPSSMGHIAIVDATQGRMASARDWFQRARQLCQEQGQATGVAAWGHNLGWLLHELGDEDQALRMLRETLALYQDLERPYAAADVRSKIGTVLLELQGPEAALPYLRAGEAGLRAFGRGGPRSVVQCELARGLARHGELEEARALWADAEAGARGAGATTEVLRVLLARAEAELGSGDGAAGERDLAEAEGLVRDLGLLPEAWLYQEAQRLRAT